MPKFSIRDLLIATALIAVGVGSITYISRPPLGHALLHGSPGNAELTAVDKFALMLILFGGGALIGAGLLTPLGDSWPWPGALIGLLIEISVLFFIRLCLR
jgi:hypothetical protein